MFGDWGRSLAWQRLAQYQFRQRRKRVTRNLRGTRRMPRGEKRRKGRGPAIKRSFLRVLR